MSGILDLINSPMGKSVLQGLSKETNQSEEKTADVLTMAMPLLLNAMKKNAASPEGAQGLLKALDNSKHDGSMLSNLDTIFTGGVNQEVKTDGAGILSHVLGSKQNNIASALSQTSGVDSQSVMQIMQMAAPVLLAYLGKEKRQNNIESSNGLESLLSNVMGTQSSKQKNILDTLSPLLDQDGDGNIIDDIGGMLGGFFKK